MCNIETNVLCPAEQFHNTIVSVIVTTSIRLRLKCDGTKLKLNSVALVRERTIPTKRPPPVGEVSANFCG